MEELGAAKLAYSAFVILLAFAVRGTTGFGGGAIAVPLLALVMPLQIVVPAVTVLNFVSSIRHGARDRRQIAWPEIFRILPFLVVGVGVGLYLLRQLDQDLLGKGLGAFVVAYAIFAFATAGKPVQVSPRALWPMAVIFGALGGFISALFGGAAGTLYAIYFSAVRLPRDVFRVTVATLLLVQGALRLGGYATLGFYDVPTLVLTAAAFPFMLVGGRLGDAIAGRVEQHTFNRIVGAVLCVSGLALVLK
jgi:uncharacterized protein